MKIKNWLKDLFHIHEWEKVPGTGVISKIPYKWNGTPMEKCSKCGEIRQKPSSYSWY